MSDRISITGLRVHGRHGVFEHERRNGQDFVVDAHLSVSLAAAGASDLVADTVDYGSVAETITKIISGEPVNLIETLASRIADACLLDPRVTGVEVTVHKPQAPVSGQFDDIAVTIARVRPGALR
ncbi:MAG: dihydroneopterin aldolase [Actinomycetota bacterium]